MWCEHKASTTANSSHLSAGKLGIVVENHLHDSSNDGDYTTEEYAPFAAELIGSLGSA